MRDTTGSEAAPAAKCRNCLRGSFMASPSREAKAISIRVPQEGAVISAFGTKRTWRLPSMMSAFGGKADIALVARAVARHTQSISPKQLANECGYFACDRGTVALGSLSPFVHWSFVAPNIFGVRMIMVPPHARFAAVPIVVQSGFAGGLNGTLSFQGWGGSLVGSKHISSPLERDNAWLHVTAHRAAVESPEPVTAIRRKLGGDQAFPKVSSPMSSVRVVAQRHCNSLS
jgi:hypothetical protein